MIDTLLHVMLGFLAASFLALAGGRLLWSRAVRLTVRRLENQLPSSVGEIVAAQDMIRAEHAVQVRGLERAVSALRSRLVAAETAATTADIERERYAIELNEKTTSVAMLEARVRQLEAELATAQGTGAEAAAARDTAREEFAALRKKLDSDTRALAEARVELDAQRVRLVAMETEITNLRDDRDATHSKLVKQQSRLDETGTDLTAARARTAELESRLSTASSERDGLETRVGELEKQRAELETALSDIKTGLSSATVQGETLKTALSERDGKIADLEAVKQALDKELGDIRTQLTSLSEREARATKRNDHLLGELDGVSRKRDAYEKRMRAAETERDDLAKALVEAKTVRADAAKQAEREKRRADRLAADLENTKSGTVSQSTSHEREKARLQTALDHATGELAKAQSAEARAVERIRALSQDLLSAQSTMDSSKLTLESNLAKVTAEKAMLEGQLASARAEWSKLERQLKRNAESGPRPRNDNGVLRARLDALADEIALFAGAELPPSREVVTSLPQRGEAAIRSAMGAG